jgi:uncharacterized protein (UPF0335 family)
VTAQAEAAVTEAALLAAKLANTLAPEAPHPVFPHVCETLKASMEAGECLACGNKVNAETAKSDLAFLEQALATYTKAMREYSALQTEVARKQAFADASVDRVERLEQELAELTGDDKTAQGNADTFGVSLEEAKSALDAADKALTDLKVVADAWASAKKAEGTAVDAEASAEEWKAFKGACEDAVAVVLGQALRAFVAKVQANLPEGDTFDLRLNDGDREVVQFGLVRSGHLHTALSSAEWARVMAAMAEACVGEGKFAVLIPEERAFDPETLGEVLAAFGATKHQVILASPVAPKKAPKGWTIVKRGGAA